MSEKKNSIDMINGPLTGRMFLFALPMALSNILQQLFNAADMAVVGRFSGSQALAAVGCNGPVVNVLLNIFVGLAAGTNVVIAACIGQKDERGVQETLHTAVLTALISGFFLLAAGRFLARPVLELMGAPAEVLPLAATYLKIYFLGMPFIVMFNFSAAILRSKGDSRRPLYSMTLAGVCNVLLNLLFVAGMGMGVEGVAIATVMSNAVSCSLLIYFLMTEEPLFRLSLGRLRICVPALRRMAAIGLPSGFQGSLFSLSNTVILSAVNSFGAFAVAGNAAAVNFDFFPYFLCDAFGQACTTFTSQNFGAGEKERCRRIYRLSLFWGMALSGLTGWTLIYFQDTLLGLFTGESAVYPFAKTRILTSILPYPLYAFQHLTAAAMRGLGRAALPALITLAGTCLLRVAWIFFVFPLRGDFSFLMLVYPISWCATGLMMALAYRNLRREML